MRNKFLVWIALVVGATLIGGTLARAEEAARKRPHLQDFPWVSSTPKEVPDRVPAQSGGDEGLRIRVGRIWKRDAQTHASVNVRNIAAYEFHDVTIVCTAFDDRNRTVGSQQAELSRQRYGPLKPGFTTDLDLAFDTGRAEVRSLSCDAHARGVPHRVD